MQKSGQTPQAHKPTHHPLTLGWLLVDLLFILTVVFLLSLSPSSLSVFVSQHPISVIAIAIVVVLMAATSIYVTTHLRYPSGRPSKIPSARPVVTQTAKPPLATLRFFTPNSWFTVQSPHQTSPTEDIQLNLIKAWITNNPWLRNQLHFMLSDVKGTTINEQDEERILMLEERLLLMEKRLDEQEQKTEAQEAFNENHNWPAQIPVWIATLNNIASIIVAIPAIIGIAYALYTLLHR